MAELRTRHKERKRLPPTTKHAGTTENKSDSKTDRCLCVQTPVTLCSRAVTLFLLLCFLAWFDRDDACSVHPRLSLGSGHSTFYRMEGLPEALNEVQEIKFQTPSIIHFGLTNGRRLRA